MKAAWILGLLLVASAHHALGQSCTLNTTIPLAKAGEQAIGHINQHKCMLDLLKTRALGTPKSEPICESITIDAGARTPVVLTAAAPLLNIETLAAEVHETGTDARLVLDGMHRASSTLITVWVWNRDAISSRSGKVCVEVVRP